MSESQTQKRIALPDWMWIALLAALLLLIYFSVFTSDYLMNDELDEIGSLRPIGARVFDTYFRFGRGLFSIPVGWLYNFGGFDPGRVQLVRFANFAANGLLAVALFRFLKNQTGRAAFSFFVILFFMSQTAMQAVVGYSFQFLAGLQPAAWLSLAAFFLYFDARKARKFPDWLKLALVFLILMAAMQFYQAFALFSMVPLAYLVLSKWETVDKKAWRYLLAAGAVIVLSTLLFRINQAYWQSLGYQVYSLGEQMLSSLTEQPFQLFVRAVNPFAYWGAFQLWTYPVAISPLGDLKGKLALVILVAWMVLMLAAALTEFLDKREERKTLVSKWLAWLLTLGFTALALIAEAPEGFVDHRAQVMLPMIGVVIFSGAYALRSLAGRFKLLSYPAALSAGVVLVLITALGAQRGVRVNLVGIRADQLDFIRTEAVSGGIEAFDQVIVILPEEVICQAEPCNPLMGSEPHQPEWHLTRPNGYQYALAAIGIEPGSKEFTFVMPGEFEPPPDAVVIDWNDYVRARQPSE